MPATVRKHRYLQLRNQCQKVFESNSSYTDMIEVTLQYVGRVTYVGIDIRS